MISVSINGFEKVAFSMTATKFFKLIHNIPPNLEQPKCRLCMCVALRNAIEVMSHEILTLVICQVCWKGVEKIAASSWHFEGILVTEPISMECLHLLHFPHSNLQLAPRNEQFFNLTFHLQFHSFIEAKVCGIQRFLKAVFILMPPVGWFDFVLLTEGFFHS